MQATKNGLKSILRTPGKTLLFLLILTVTAALLMISCCVYGAVRGYLNDCDDYFHTIAELEYLGAEYPSQTVYDEAFADAVEENQGLLSQLVRSESVLAWEPASSELLLSPILHRLDSFVPDPNAAVLRVKPYAFLEDHGIYNVLVTETLYSRVNYTDKLILLRAANGENSLECGKSYLIAGHYYTANSSSAAFQQEAVSFLADGAVTELPLQLSEGAGEAEEALFYRYAEALHLKNDACRVTYTAAVEDLYAFHQQVLTLTAGRYFTQEEYDSKARVCLISERMAGLLEKKIGDRIPAAVFRAAGDVYVASHLTQIDEGDYEIIGTVSHSEYYPFWVFFPDAEAKTSVCPVNGYTLGQFRLKNDAVAAFRQEAAPLLEKGFRLNVYDQGYAAATEPMEELLFISGIFLAVCLLLAFCALALQSFLFISRQREAARTMFQLGSGRRHICVYFLSSALALMSLSAALGVLIGKLAEGRVFAVLQRFASQFANQDVRFSATRIAVSRTLSFNPASSPEAYLSAVGILAGGTLILTLLFALASLRERKTKKKKAARQIAPKRTVRVSRLSGTFKYGILSLRRGMVRSLAVLLLGIAAAMFFGRLSSSLLGYREQLASYKSNAVISGSATDLYAKRIDGLTLWGDLVGQLGTNELLKDRCATRKVGNLKILGVEGGEQIPFSMPDPIREGEAYESACFRISKGPAVVGTSSVSCSPIFHFSESGSVTWLEGWSEADFTGVEERTWVPQKESYWQIENYYTWVELYLSMPDIYWADIERELPFKSGAYICAVPETLMEEYGIRLGDKINTMLCYAHPDLDYIGQKSEQMFPLQLTVVASYVAPVGSTTVFTPLTFVPPGLEHKKYFPQLQYDPEQLYVIGGRTWIGSELERFREIGVSPALSYSSLTFTLADTTKLDRLRDTLEESGFTWVHSGDRMKKCAMIEDETYLNTTRSMERQIQYVSVLYTALYLLAGLIGFALAWLLVQSRRREIAVMRALGTQPGRIVGNFLLEQLLNMTAGLGFGVLLFRLAGTSLNRTQFLLTAAFLEVWVFSALICLIVGLRKKSFAALTEPE